MNIHEEAGRQLLAQLAAVDPDAPVQFTLRAADAARAVAAFGGPMERDPAAADDLLDMEAMCTLAGRSNSTVRAWLQEESREGGRCPGAFKLSGVDWRCPRAEFLSALRGRSKSTPPPRAEPRTTREPIGAWRAGRETK